MGHRVNQKEPLFQNIQARQNAYKELFEGSDVGRLVLGDLLEECAVARSAFCKGDTSQTSVNLGKQLVGYHIMTLLNIQLQEIK